MGSSMPQVACRDISPPPLRRDASSKAEPSPAAIEAGQAVIDDHLAYFSDKLAESCRQTGADDRLSISAYRNLYLEHQHDQGCHFVVHQHDHPIAGVHYDLRLQFSSTSTISFAVPYGLPGNPNSIRPNRLAIETRVHNLWNNLIESASHATGSLLIWDTGCYEVLPYRENAEEPTTDDEEESTISESHSQSLFQAFQTKHIRLRLHGHRLPKGYTVSLRLPSMNKYKPAPAKRRRTHRVRKARRSSSSDSESVETAQLATASDDDEDATIRANNAYTGATNTIGSIHQRCWFLSLDKANSGLERRDGRWEGWPPFFVMGREVERSVVTGRTADDVMRDAGVQSFTGRKMWRPVVE